MLAFKAARIGREYAKDDRDAARRARASRRRHQVGTICTMCRSTVPLTRPTRSKASAKPMRQPTTTRLAGDSMHSTHVRSNVCVSAAAAHDRTGHPRLQTLVGPRLCQRWFTIAPEQGSASRHSRRLEAPLPHARTSRAGRAHGQARGGRQSGELSPSDRRADDPCS